MTSRVPAVAERGAAYLLALTALLALTGLGVAISHLGSMERRLGAAWSDRWRALNAADSGLEIAAARLATTHAGGDLEIELVSERRGSVWAVERVKLEPPELFSVGRCDACDPDAGEIARVGYRLGAVGERSVVDSLEAPGTERLLSRVTVEALVTLQPWPSPLAGSGGDWSSDPSCSDASVLARVASGLTRELNPGRCRLIDRSLAVPGVDPETGAVCVIEVPVCVLVSDWREHVLE